MAYPNGANAGHDEARRCRRTPSIEDKVIVNLPCRSPRLTARPPGCRRRHRSPRPTGTRSTRAPERRRASAWQSRHAGQPDAEPADDEARRDPRPSGASRMRQSPSASPAYCTRKCRGIGTAAEERRVAERDHSARAHHEMEARGEQREDHDIGRAAPWRMLLPARGTSASAKKDGRHDQARPDRRQVARSAVPAARADHAGPAFSGRPQQTPRDARSGRWP